MSAQECALQSASSSWQSGSADGDRRDISFVDIGSHRLGVSRHGHGPPLLLLGGPRNNLGVWRNLIRALPDLHTIAVDAPGTGESTTPVVPLSMAARAKIYAALLEHLGLSRVVVLGLSFGGAVAQQLAYQSPDLVEGLVLCGTGPRAGLLGSIVTLGELASPMRYGDVAQPCRDLTNVYGGWFTGDSADLARELHELTLGPSLYGYFCQLAALAGWSSLPWLDRIQLPTLVIAADEDPVYPVINGRMLAQFIPEVRLEVPTGAGHLFVKDRADDVASLVGRFVGKATPL